MDNLKSILFSKINYKLKFKNILFLNFCLITALYLLFQNQFVFAQTSEWAEKPDEINTATLRIFIKDSQTNEKLSGVQVEAEGHNTIFSGSNGKVVLYVPPGSSTNITFSKEGYETTTRIFTPSGASGIRTVNMNPKTADWMEKPNGINTATLRIYLKDSQTDEKLSGVQVDAEGHNTIFSGSTGKVVLFVPPGSSTNITFSKEGYETTTRIFTPSGATGIRTVNMNPKTADWM